MDRTLLFVGAGGMLGSIARYLVGYALAKPVAEGFPFGTFAVNVAGCFIIGVVYGLSERAGWLTAEWRTFLGVGFCGGFTTFSAFSYESVRLLQQKDHATLGIYVVLSLVACLAATFLGLFLSKP